LGRLAGKVAVVTGGTQGIGKGIVLRLASEGAAVLFCSRNPETSSALLAEIEKRGANGAYVRADVGVRAQAQNVVHEAVRRFGTVDMLINNAQSRTPPAALEEKPDEEFNGLFQGGLMASLWMMRSVLPHMRQRGWGRIVNFSSFSVVTGMAGKSDYNTAKAAIAALTRSAAQEWGRYGITVNAICPAGANEAIQAFLSTDPTAASAIAKDIPLGRIGDCEQDIGSAVLGLVSQDMGFVTGHTLMLDGGGHLRPPVSFAGRLPVKTKPAA
jgi:NAD(P)-dependent dehydrogenase (short-subunit alcohol dehydrogenase family)